MQDKAALILIHNIDNTLQELIEGLTLRGYNIFVHADTKMGALDTRFFQQYPEVRIFQKYPIFWGGFNMIQAMILLLGEAHSNAVNERFIFLSGRDCINHRIKIHQLAIKDRRTRLVIKNHYLNRNFFHRRRFGKYMVDSLASNFRVKESISEQIFCRVKNNLHALLNPNIQMQYQTFLKGSQWITLDKEDADICLKAMMDPEKRFFWSRFPCPDEWFFYTNLNAELPGKYNFRRLSDNIDWLGYEHHLIDWTQNQMSPSAVSLTKFQKTDFLFGRKIVDDRSGDSIG
jgi:hypothetical protein